MCSVMIVHDSKCSHAKVSFSLYEMVAILDLCVTMMFKHQNDVIVVILVVDLSKRGSSHMTQLKVFFLSWYRRPSWIWPSGRKMQGF